MRRLMAVLLAILLVPLGAMAEIVCICGQEACICFIQYGDTGPAVKAIREELKEQGYLPGKFRAAAFNEEYVEAVKRFQQDHELPETGMMDDVTLTWLLWGMSPDALDLAEPLLSAVCHWVPTDGGTKMHNRSLCSDMYDPRMISERNGIKMGILHCKKPDCK